MKIALLALFFIISIASQGLEPQLNISNPTEGTEISQDVNINFTAIGNNLTNPQLSIQGWIGFVNIPVQQENCILTINPNEDFLNCQISWNPHSVNPSGFDNGNATITASVNSETGILSDNVVVLISGHFAK